MIYKATIDNKPYWVPIVVKNRDFLVGYIKGFNLIKEMVEESAKKLDMDLDFGEVDLCLDSSRFNDVIGDGRHERDLSENELNEYYKSEIERKISKMSIKHPENQKNVFDDVLTVECNCGLGIYSYKHYNDIPDKPVNCQICGKKIIDYTQYDDSEFEFDGE
jgi:hypothetical protein